MSFPAESPVAPKAASPGLLIMVMLLHALALASHLLPAAADVCARDATDIRVFPKIAPPTTDFSKSDAQLKTMKGGGIPASDPRFVTVAGLTFGSIGINSEVRIASVQAALGQICVWPSVVSVTLTTSPAVYIGADQGHCRTQSALEHEMHHVAVDREIIDRYTLIFRRRINAMVDAIGTVGPLPAADLSTVRRRIEEKINAAIAVAGDQLEAEREARQRDLDSPNEYARLSMVCPQLQTETR